MKVLFIGDIVGKVGRITLKGLLSNLVDRYKIDIVIANGENMAGGFGITEKTADEVLACGVNIITSGNHIWDKKNLFRILQKEQDIEAC